MLTLPSALITIGFSAFKGCSALTSATLPASLTTIGNYAFEGCSTLTELSLSAALTTLGIGAFEDTSLSPTAREAISALTYPIETLL